MMGLCQFCECVPCSCAAGPNLFEGGIQEHRQDFYQEAFMQFDTAYQNNTTNHMGLLDFGQYSYQNVYTDNNNSHAGSTSTPINLLTPFSAAPTPGDGIMSDHPIDLEEEERLAGAYLPNPIVSLQACCTRIRSNTNRAHWSARSSRPAIW